MNNSMAPLSALFACVVGVSSAGAAVIDFETVPGDTPSEGLQITNQFASAGVTFGLVDGLTGVAVAGGPVIARVGAPITAFDGGAFGDDGIDPVDQARIGDFFLTDDGLTSTGIRNPILVVTYSVASSFFTADILDIDFSETFEIRAYDAVTGGNLLNTINLTTSSPDTNNGIATQVGYNHGSDAILRVEFEGQGNVTPSAGFFGLGFDNFDSGVTVDPTPAVPLPAGLPLLLAGLGGLWALRRRS